MNQYELQNAIFKILGYYFPQDTYGFDLEAEFDKAKVECLENIRKQTKHIESVTWEQFNKQHR